MLKANRDLGYHISEGTIRHVVPLQIALFLQEVEPNGDIKDSKICKNSARGRKPVVYAALPLEVIQQRLTDRIGKRLYERHHLVDQEAILARPTPSMMLTAGVRQDNEAVASELDTAYRPAYRQQHNRERTAGEEALGEYQRWTEALADLSSTPLPDGWPKGTVGDYRAAFLRGTVEQSPDQKRSREEIGQLLGIANGSISDTIKRAGLKAEEHYEAVPLTSQGRIKDEIWQTGQRIRGYPKQIISRDADGQTHKEHYKQETALAIIRREQAAGAEVSIRYQTASIPRIVSETPLLPARKPARTPSTRSPHSRSTAARSTLPRFYGPGYNPAWILQQFELGIRLMGRLQQLADPGTGEIIVPDSALDMLRVLLGRPANSSEGLDLPASDDLTPPHEVAV